MPTKELFLRVFCKNLSIQARWFVPAALRGDSIRGGEIVEAGIAVRRRRAELIASSGLGYTAFLAEGVLHQRQDVWNDDERASGAARRQLESVIETVSSSDNGIAVRIVPRRAAATIGRPLVNFEAVTVAEGGAAGLTVVQEFGHADSLLGSEDAATFMAAQLPALDNAAFGPDASLALMERIAAQL